MKKIVVVLVSLVVAVLVIGGNAFAHIPDPSLGPEWQLVATGYSGTTYYVNTMGIQGYLPGKYLVPILYVPRGEDMREDINDLKRDLLSEGENPLDVVKFWYTVELIKLNCRTNLYALLKITYYSFGKAVLYSYSLPHEWWWNIIPGSSYDKIEKFVCK